MTDIAEAFPPAGSVLPRDAVADLSGFEVLKGILTGALPAPPYAVTARIRPVELGEGFVVFEGEPHEHFLNPLGTIHGGWTAGLLDTVMACAIHSRLAAGQTYTTVEMKTNFVRAITPKLKRVRCEGKVLHFGGRIATSEGRLVDENGTLLAHGTETCLIMEARRG